MQVRVLFFGMLAEAAGRRGETLSLAPEATVADLLAACARQFPATGAFFGSIAVSLNQQYAARDAALHENDEVGLLPPVSGGAPESAAESSVFLTRGPIDVRRIAQQLQQPQDGACATFEGIVRDHSRGRRTLCLEYEAYEEMALKQMQALAEESLRLFDVRAVAVVHRLGRLQIGECSVFIAVVSGHRAAAFEACRWLIDTLKQSVPIWKKEFFEDGAVWAPGQPFPPGVRSL